MMEESRERGFYKLTLTAGSQVPTGDSSLAPIPISLLQDKRLIGTNGAELAVKVMTEIEIDHVQVGVFDRDHAQATHAIEYLSHSLLSSPFIQYQAE